MAKAVGTNKDIVQRVWSAHGLKPHLTKTFKVSNDPHFAEKVVDVVGLYLNPPEHALVLSVDEMFDSGTGSHSEKPADVSRSVGHDDARLQTEWHNHTVCRLERHRWNRKRQPASRL